MIVRRNPRLYLKMLTRAVGVAVKLAVTYPRLKATYLQHYPNLTSQDFWRRQFAAQETPATAAQSAQPVAPSPSGTPTGARNNTSIPPAVVLSS